MVCWLNYAKFVFQQRGSSSSTGTVVIRNNLCHNSELWRLPKSSTSQQLGIRKWRNSVRTTKHHWLLFIPYSLLQQIFLVPTNTFFVFIGAMQLVPSISDSGGLPTTWLPLVFVMGVTIIKDAYEEYKRARSDTLENNKIVDVLSEGNQWTKRRWADLRPGDYIKVHCDETVPADILLINSSDRYGICNVATKDLDGESNLKIRTCMPELLANIEDTDGQVNMERDIEVYVSPPNEDMYSFDGVIVCYPTSVKRKVVDFHEVSDDISQLISEAEANGGVAYPFSMNQVLLRGCQLAATDEVQGIVMYIGHKSKIYMNSRTRRAKRTALFRCVVRHIISTGTIGLLLCVIVAAMGTSSTDDVTKHWYLLLHESLEPLMRDEMMGALDESEITSRKQTKWTAFFVTMGRMCLLLSYLIPITLVVQLELSHWANAAQMGYDDKMLTEIHDDQEETIPPAVEKSEVPDDASVFVSIETNTPYTAPEELKPDIARIREPVKKIGCTVKSVDVLDDLGCISHIFSDKTGTLTQNMMRLSAVSVGGRLTMDSSAEGSHWRGNFVKIDIDDIFENIETKLDIGDATKITDFIRCLSLCHSVVIDRNIPEVTERGEAYSRSVTSWTPRVRSHHTKPRRMPADEFSSFSRYSVIVDSAEFDNATQTQLQHSILSFLNTDQTARYEDIITADPPSECFSDGFRTATAHLTNNERDSVVKASRTTYDGTLPTYDHISSTPTTIALASSQHTVIGYPVNRRCKSNYDASSPDEMALVCFAKTLGVEFVARPKPSIMTISFTTPLSSRMFCPKLQDGDISLSGIRLLEDYSNHVASGETHEFQYVYSSEPVVPYGQVELPGVKYKILDVLEFDNIRKRMSTIVVDEVGVIRVLVKGADNMLLPRCTQEKGPYSGSYHETVVEHLRTMSMKGLRTLVFAQRVLTAADYNEYRKLLATTRAHQEGQEALIKVYDQIESNLELLGATGISDELQEDCVETIKAVKDAGISLWVLTGDKLETAISIGYSAKLLDSETYINIVDGDSVEQVQQQLHRCIIYVIGATLATKGQDNKQSTRDPKQLNPVYRWNEFLKLLRFTPEANRLKQVDYDEKRVNKLSERDLQMVVQTYLEEFSKNNRTTSLIGGTRVMEGRPETRDEELRTITKLSKECTSYTMHRFRDLSLTVTGEALNHIFSYEPNLRLFFALANLCSVVLACRVSPLQKSLVVAYAKEYLDGLDDKSFRSLAIGDGANDVAMILSADIGIGIQGQEGAQAARSADLSIGKFKHLRNILFCHGHEAIRRNSFMVYHTLWKNTFFGSTAFWYAFFCKYSAVDLYNSWLKQFYNLIFTSAPIMFFAWFDRYLPYHVMLRFPALYPIYSRPDGGMHFGRKWFFWWIVLGLVGSLVVTIFPLIVLNWGLGPNNWTWADFDAYGHAVFNMAVFIGCISVIPFISSWNGFFILTFIICLGTYLIFWVAVSQVYYFDIYNSFYLLNHLMQYHLACFLVIQMILFPLVFWWLYKIIFRPSRQTVIQERMRLGVHDLIVGMERRQSVPVLVPSVAAKEGSTYAFSEQPATNRITLQNEYDIRRKMAEINLLGDRSTVSANI